MNFYKHLKRNREFIGHVGTILSGRSVAAIVGLLVTPIVARLFSPADFGIAASFLAIAGIAAQVATLRYEAAFTLPKDDREALLLVALATRILPTFCLFLLVLVALTKLSGVNWRALDLLGDWAWLLPLTVLMMSMQDVQESWLARKKSFGVISRSVVLDTSLGGAARIGLGTAAGSSVYGLILGHLFGVTGRLFLQGRAARDSLKATFGHVDWRSLKEIARQYSDFPRMNAPAGLVYSSSQNLPVLLFGVLFSPAVAGFFAMANRLSKIPILVVSNSIRRVFLQKAATIYNEGKSLGRPLMLTILGLLTLGALPCAAVWKYGGPVLTWLLGSKWQTAGQFLEIIAPWVLAAWAASPCNAVFIVLRKQSHWLALQTVVTAARLGSFAVAYALDMGPERTLALFVLIAVAGNVATVIFAATLARGTRASVGESADVA